MNVNDIQPLHNRLRELCNRVNCPFTASSAWDALVAECQSQTELTMVLCYLFSDFSAKYVDTLLDNAAKALIIASDAPVERFSHQLYFRGKPLGRSDSYDC